MTQTADTKCLNKRKIAKYIYHHDGASKQEIAQELGLSMPTVLQRVKELIGEGVVTESGEYESTGGRKAKALSIAAEKCFSVGMDITGNHVSLVLLDAGGRLRAKRRLRKPFCDIYVYLLAGSASEGIFKKEPYPGGVPSGGGNLHPRHCGRGARPHDPFPCP